MKRILGLLACVRLSAAGAWAQPPATNPPTEARPASDGAQLPEIQKQLDWDVRRLKDWAELGRYRAANAALAPATDAARVVFMGDLITDMWQLPTRPVGYAKPGKKKPPGATQARGEC